MRLKRNIVSEAIAGIDSVPSDRSGRSQLETLWKEFTIWDAMKDIHGSRKEVKISKISTFSATVLWHT